MRILGFLLDAETLKTFNLTNKQAVTVYQTISLVKGGSTIDCARQMGSIRNSKCH